MKNKPLLPRGLGLLLLSFFLVSFSYGQGAYFYYYKGDKIQLTLNKKIINISVFKNFSTSELDRLNVKSFDFQKDLSQSTPSDLRYAKIEFQNEPKSESELFERISAIKSLTGARTVYPSFFAENGEEVGLSDYVYVKLKKVGDVGLLREQAKKYNMEIVEQNQYMPLWYTLRCSEKTPYSSLEVANKIMDSKMFSECAPDMMTYEDAYCTNDPLFSTLWGLNNSANTDINVCQAWNISEGAGVIVAVLDQGIDKSHLDLNTNIYSQSFNTETGTSPSQLFGSHGTHVAGTIAAIKNNSRQVVGVAPKAKLMDISNSLYGTPNSRIKRADGFMWAYKHGADIISNSWGSGVRYTIIDDAIDSAMYRGRNGKGTIVLFSSGNSGASSIGYPADASPDIIAVGAMQESGGRASFSQYGTGLDIVAPGVGVNSTLPNNLTGYYSGTSMACPHVAGVAALVLAVKPCLTRAQVTDILEKSARKIGGYSYTTTPGRTNGTWNNQMGYGIVDAHAAVLLAQTTGCEPVTCSATLTSFPYNEGFESGIGLWRQDPNDNFDWTRKSGGTPSSYTGPPSAAQGRYYMYTEASGKTAGKKAILYSPCVDLTNKVGYRMNFQYHMYGSRMGNLRIQASTDNGTTWTTVWYKAGNQGYAWRSGNIDLNSFAGKVVQFRIIGTIGTSYTSDIAIDKINISKTATCTSIVTAFPYVESFERNFGGWTQSLADNFNWSRRSGSTPSSYTGPPGAAHGTKYIYTEASYNTPRKVAILNSPCFNLFGQSNMRLYFKYCMYGAAMGNLKVQISTNGGATWKTIWTKSGNQGYVWRTASVNLQSYSGKLIKLRLVGTTGTAYTSDMAVDKIEIRRSNPCITTITSFPYNEGFESGLGAWRQEYSDDFDWTRKSGSTPSSYTGPPGAAQGSYYMYTEASGNNSPNKVAILNGPCVNLVGRNNMHFNFSYCMFGAAMGSLSVQVSANGGLTWSNRWFVRGNKGYIWKRGTVNLAPYAGKVIKIRFVATTGTSYTSDIAIDKVNISTTVNSTDPNNGTVAGEVSQQNQTATPVTVDGKPGLKLYPNPANTFITVNYIAENAAQVKISIVDVTGRELYSASTEVSEGENTTRVPLDALSPGSYMMLLDDGNGNILHEKFIINR